VAQGQFAAGPTVPDGTTVRPGDLVFFGTGPSGVDHVGIYVGSGLMIDAPHAGAVVRVEAADWPGLVGATRPG
jgi:cell wall-associated NlpC family hydrolase